MMSATPIPRTLQMTYDADLDVSVIDELPPGSKPVATRTYSAARRGEVLARIRAACAEGRAGLLGLPGDRGVEGQELQAALDTYEELRAELPDLRVGLVHGRMAPAGEGGGDAGFRRGRRHSCWSAPR